MGKYFSHPSGGPCWSRDKGYHTPAPVPVFHPAHPQSLPTKPQSPPEGEKCPIHGIAECMCDDPADWAEWTSTES